MGLTPTLHWLIVRLGGLFHHWELGKGLLCEELSDLIHAHRMQEIAILRVLTHDPAGAKQLNPALSHLRMPHEGILRQHHPRVLHQARSDEVPFLENPDDLPFFEALGVQHQDHRRLNPEGQAVLREGVRGACGQSTRLWTRHGSRLIKKIPL